jgi:hypothetical protein
MTKRAAYAVRTSIRASLPGHECPRDPSHRTCGGMAVTSGPLQDIPHEDRIGDLPT